MCSDLAERPAMRARRRARERGFTLLETLAVLAIAAILLAGLMSLVNTSYTNARAQQAALYQSQLSSAAQQLIEANYQTLLTASMTTTKPIVIALGSSSPAGFQLSTYLPATFRSLNPYQQTPCLLVYRGPGTGWSGGNGPKDIEAFLVTEGGQTIDDRTLGNIEANAGAGAGAIQAMGNGAVQGAFGSWSAPLSVVNAANTSCSGTPTATGHLVTQVYYSGGSGAAGDFLYRQPVSVTGVADGNTMHAPIVLADQTHADRTPDVDCEGGVGTGKVTADSAGNLLNCDGTMWQLQGSMHWRAPVEDYGDLAALTNAQIGDVVLVTSLGRAFTYTGTTWQALAVDQNGNLEVPGVIDLGNTQTVGTACTPLSASATQVAADSSGRVLSCQSGIWQPQTEIDVGENLTDCLIVAANPNGGASDSSTCTQHYTGSIASPSGALSYSAAHNTYTYTSSIPISLAKNGIVSAAVWETFSMEVCNTDGYVGQVSLEVDLINNDTGVTMATTKGSPNGNVVDSAVTVNTFLQNAITPNTNGYTIKLTTNWRWMQEAGQAMAPPPVFAASSCGGGDPVNGLTVRTPVFYGWNISTYY